MIQITASDVGKAPHTRHDAVFRLFIYEGPANVATAYEITGCSVEKALEAAEMLSHKNALLWSLALVVNAETAASAPELIWISGMDYRQHPATARQWGSRQEMQDRYFSARSTSEESPTLPNGLKRIRMFPEWGVDVPLWGTLPDPYPYEPGMLPITAELERELIEWSREWGSYDIDVAERPDAWYERGWSLCERLQKELENFAEIIPALGATNEA